MSQRYGIACANTPSDWSTFLAAVKAAGRDFMVRRLESVTAAELTAAASAGVDHVFVWSPTRTQALGGSAAGASAATSALAALTALGVTTDCPVYYGCETDALGAQVEAFYQGVATVVAVSKIGAYASGRVLSYLNDRSRVTYGAQLLGWQHGQGWYPAGNLIQAQYNYPLGGLVCSKWESRATAFGQYRDGAGVEPAAPSTLALPTAAAAAPHGLVIRTGRKDEELILRIKDENGKEAEYRGRVRTRYGGLVPRISCDDAAANWDKLVCEWTFDHASVGTIIRQVVEDPTGGRPSGIVCHVEEPVWKAGHPIMLSSWSGNGRTVRTILDDFCEMTGARWTLQSIGGVWHFHFGHPANWPEWDTLVDGSRETTPGTQRRIVDPKGEVNISQTNEGFANRVNFPRTIEPPTLPVGMSNWGEVWTEDASKWRGYGSGVVIANDLPAPGFGDNSIGFTYSYTAPATGQVALPAYVDLGYATVPGSLCDMSTWHWGWLSALCRCWVTTDQGIADGYEPKSIVQPVLYLHSGAYPGPLNQSNCSARLAPNQTTGGKWTFQKWRLYGAIEETENANGETLFDPTNVRWIQLRLECFNPRGYVALTAGHTWTLEFHLDGMKPIGASAAEDAPTTSESFVEAEAVTDGIEEPIPMTIQDMTLPFQDMDALGNLCLEEHYRTRTTVGPLRVAGVVDIPVLSRLPLDLSRVGVTDVSYAPVAITHKPFEDVTEITLGDAPYDEAHADAVVRRMFDRTRAQNA